MTEIHTHYTDLPPQAKGCVAAIGNFDGVHQGHQHLLAQARGVAARLGAPCAVVTFEPHPRLFFQPKAPPFVITPLPARLRILESLGIDHVFALPFDAALARMTGEEFIETVLENGIGARHVVVGEDFAFGRNRSGTGATLQAAADRGAFGLLRVPPATCANGEVCSSSRIRALLRLGHLEKAQALMGRPFEWEGEIIHGEKRGRALGFPTANQDVARYLHLPYGIYAVQARIGGEARWREGVASYGIRPMFKVEQPLLETHLLDLDAEIYGNNMRVRPVKRLREEMKFSDIEELKKRMRQDCLDAAAVLKSA